MRRPILTLAAAAASMASRAAGRRPRRPASPRARRPAPLRRARRPARPPSAERGGGELQHERVRDDHAAAPAIDLSTVGGAGEGALNLIIWGGYAEDGSNVPEYDWVTAFEAETGCKVNTKVGDTSDEMVTADAHSGGTYDGVSRVRRRDRSG